LKPEELYRYVRAFGFGRKTGVDLPGEVNGLLAPPARWSKLSPFIIPIGQEVAVTPIQLAVMTAVVANGGLRVRPYVVDRIQTPDGLVVRSHIHFASRNVSDDHRELSRRKNQGTTGVSSGDLPSDRESVRVISPQTASTLQTILTSVVESGTGQLANVQGLTVAGKTGTAQKLEPTGLFSHSRFVASFVGFGPVPDSRFVIVVCVDEPRPLYFGGVVSAPMFKRMVEQLVSYWGLERRVAPRVAQAAG
jgi:cell division protein FtsI/penicillin-binding protein 2